MTGAKAPIRLTCEDALQTHLKGLAACDLRLEIAIARAQPIALRTGVPGFEGMARIICGQQLSVASARAIWGRVEALGATDPEAFLGFGEMELRATGLSRGKYETIQGLANAVAEGHLDFDAVRAMEAEQAIEKLTALKGIGPWSAEIYLLFCTGHPDIFPSGDLALQKAAAHALGLDVRPTAKHLAGITQEWSPHRGAAAIMLWRYFSVMNQSNAWDAL